MSRVWLYEDGIGEERAALVSGGRIERVRIARKDGRVRCGAVVEAKLLRKWRGKARGIAALESGEHAIVSRLVDIDEGSTFLADITREAMFEKGAEAGREKFAHARPARRDAIARASPTLREELGADGIAIETCPAHGTDRLSAAGWNEIMHEALSGEVAFAGGTLSIHPTPAMTLIDVDGEGEPRTLALAAVPVAAHAIVRLDIGGSVGIDFPTLSSRSDRHAVAEAFDAAMPGDCERTAVNGFGFMQVVRKRVRASLCEIVSRDRDMTQLLTLLRRSERSQGHGELLLGLTPRMAQLFDKQEGFKEALERRTGRLVTIETLQGCSEDAAFVKE